MYVVGLGLGPMFSAPLSEVFGRKMVYFVNLPIFMLFTMGAGLARNMETLAICRAFAGIFGGPALAVSAGSFVDIWDLKASGSAVTVQALATFMGPAIGTFPHLVYIPLSYADDPRSRRGRLPSRRQGLALDHVDRNNPRRRAPRSTRAPGGILQARNPQTSSPRPRPGPSPQTRPKDRPKNDLHHHPRAAHTYALQRTHRPSCKPPHQ